MNSSVDFLRHRLRNQHLVTPSLTKSDEIVSHLVAVQAQVWDMAKWAIGLRAPDLTDGDVEAAFNAGLLLRTHVLRPTWHFVAPADIRWMLALSGPRVTAFNASMARKLELDRSLLNRSNDVLAAALAGGKFLTRPALQAALAAAGIHAEGQRLAYVVMQAELDAVVCSGPRLGKQFSYALLDERVPPTRALARDEALFELTRRYFTSRSPATLHDFVWWSGLTMQDARSGVAMLPPEFVQRNLGGQTYVFLPQALAEVSLQQTTFLLPDYDEYGISYKNRSALFTEGPPVSAGNGTYPHVLVMDGVAAGTWKRTDQGKTVQVETTLVQSPDEPRQRALLAAVDQYRRFFQR